MENEEKYERGKHPNSLKNLIPMDNSDPKMQELQNIGKIEASKKKNLLFSARTMFDNAEILPDMVDAIKEEVQKGKLKNAIAFFNAIKESETQNINLNGGVEVQKIFIDEKTKQETKKHIKEFIDD